MSDTVIRCTALMHGMSWNIFLHLVEVNVEKVIVCKVLSLQSGQRYDGKKFDEGLRSLQLN